MSKNNNSIKPPDVDDSYRTKSIKEEIDQKHVDEITNVDKKPNPSYCTTNCADDGHQNHYSQSSIKIKTEDGKTAQIGCPNEKSSRCGPDFNELMDDSTNDLEMHIDENVSRDEDDGIKKEENNNKIDNCIKDVHTFSSGRHNLISNNGASKISSVSAFRPVTNDTKDLLSKTMDISNAMSPLGPYPPVGATFVGYPDNTGLTSPEKEPPHSLASGKQTPNICLLQPKPRNKISHKIEDSLSTISSNDSRSAESPETMQKEYTILQPAGSSKVNSTSSRNISMDSSSNSESSVTTNLPRPTKFETSPSNSPSSESSKHILDTQRFNDHLSAGGLNKGSLRSFGEFLSHVVVLPNKLVFRIAYLFAKKNVGSRAVLVEMSFSSDLLTVADNAFSHFTSSFSSLKAEKRDGQGGQICP